MSWLPYALLSAAFAAATAILAKVGVASVPSNLATAIRTTVVLVFVAPIDKLSLPFTIVLAWFVLGETLTVRTVAGVLLMAAGALITLR